MRCLWDCLTVTGSSGSVNTPHTNAFSGQLAPQHSVSARKIQRLLVSFIQCFPQYYRESLDAFMLWTEGWSNLRSALYSNFCRSENESSLLGRGQSAKIVRCHLGTYTSHSTGWSSFSTEITHASGNTHACTYTSVANTNTHTHTPVYSVLLSY